MESPGFVLTVCFTDGCEPPGTKTLPGAADLPSVELARGRFDVKSMAQTAQQRARDGWPGVTRQTRFRRLVRCVGEGRERT